MICQVYVNKWTTLLMIRILLTFTGYSCADGLSCQPGVHKCFDLPRKLGQPCAAGHGCGKRLKCQAFTQVCVKDAGRGYYPAYPSRDAYASRAQTMRDLFLAQRLEEGARARFPENIY